MERMTRFTIEQRTAESFLTADKPWEASGITGCTWIREGDLWRLWYGAWLPNTQRDDDLLSCYAESTDGVHWTKPNLGLTEFAGNRNNNIVFACSEAGGIMPNHIFLDARAKLSERYKMIASKFDEPNQAWAVHGGISPDGIHWSFLPQSLNAQNSDTQTVCIPEAGKYRLYTRMWTGTLWSNPGKRIIGYSESDHFGDFPNPVEIMRADDGDPEDMDLYYNAATKLADDLYVMFPGGFYTKDQTIRAHLAWSSDGVHFNRYGREPVVDIGPAFDSGMLIVNPGAVPGDAPNTWWFYYFGTSRKHNQGLAAINYAGMGRFLLALSD
jgi:hypothetical protein